MAIPTPLTEARLDLIEDYFKYPRNQECQAIISLVKNIRTHSKIGGWDTIDTEEVRKIIAKYDPVAYIAQVGDALVKHIELKIKEEK